MNGTAIRPAIMRSLIRLPTNWKSRSTRFASRKTYGSLTGTGVQSSCANMYLIKRAFAHNDA